MDLGNKYFISYLRRHNRDKNEPPEILNEYYERFIKYRDEHRLYNRTHKEQIKHHFNMFVLFNPTYYIEYRKKNKKKIYRYNQNYYKEHHDTINERNKIRYFEMKMKLEKL